jgi:putative sterol carrier protein
MTEYIFPSREWAEEFCRRLNESKAYRDSAKKWEGSILFSAVNLPDEVKKIHGRDSAGFLLDLWHGECRGMEWFDDVSEGEAKADYVLEATYDDWIKVIEGKVNPVAALVTKKIKVKKGSIATIMRFTLASINMVKAAQEVPTKKL